MSDRNTQRTMPARFDFEKVDIFLRVKGRLPDRETDILTQEILDEFCREYENGNLTAGIVPLEYMYNLIKSGRIKIVPKSPRTG